MGFRARAGQDGRKSTSSRTPPPPILTNSHHPSVSSRPSTLSTVSTTATSLPSAASSPHHLSVPSSAPPIPISPLSSSSLPTLHCGLLKKKSPSGFSYHTRFFALSSHFLSYFAKSGDRFPLGYLSLSEIASISSSGSSIELGLGGAAVAGGDKERKYRLVADSKEECEGWRRHIERAISALQRDDSKRRTAPLDEDSSPRTPMALKRTSHDGEWKEEPSELEKAFFALKFSGKRGAALCRTLMDVRSNLDILRLLIELLLDAPELRQGHVMSVHSPNSPHRRTSGPSALSLPPAMRAAVAAVNGATTGHARAVSALVGAEVEEYKDPRPTASVSDPTSPRGSLRAGAGGGEAVKADRTMSVISASAFTSKVQQLRDKLASYSLLVAALSFDDKQFLLSWLSSPSVLSSLSSLLLSPHALLHDRVLRLLYLHCQLQVRREKRLKLVGGDEEWVTEAVGDRYTALMKRQLGKVTLPSLQLQLFHSLLLMLTTPLSAFSHPVLPSAISFTHTRIQQPSVLRTIFASLFRTDLNLRKKVLKDFSTVMAQRGHGTVLVREREATRWLLLTLCDLPVRARKKNGVIRKVLDYAMKLLSTMHLIAFKGTEHHGDLKPSTDEKKAGAAEERPVPVQVPLFPDLLARALFLSSECSPRHYHSTARSILLYLITDLLQRPGLFVAASAPSSGQSTPRSSGGPPMLHMESLCYHNLLHVLALIKTFVFLPDRFAEMIGRAESAVPASSAARVRASSDSAETRGRRSSSLSTLPFTASSSFITDLIPSSALTSTLQYDNPHDPLLLDLPALLNLPLAPLTTEAATAAPASLASPISASLDTELPSLLAGNVGRYDVHRLEKRGVKADAELLAQVSRLLGALCADAWHNLPSFAVKGGIRVGERLAAELGFFQDAYVFLLLLAPMVSTSAASSAVSAAAVNPVAALAAPSAAFTTSLLTPEETGEIVEQFLSAKPSGRRKVFRHYELRFRSREQAENRAAETRSKEIEQQMEADAARERHTAKVLLLGPAEAGKSTLFKQMKRTYGEGFDAMDRASHVVVILANLLRAMRALIFHSDRLLVRFPFSALTNVTGSSTTTIDPSLVDSKAFITSFDLLEHFPSLQLNSAEKIVPQVVPASTPSVLTGEAFSSLVALSLQHLAALWADLGAQLTYENRAKFDLHQLYDGDGFFLSRLPEIRDIRWLPTEEDIIRTRIRSLGVHQYQWEDPAGGRYRVTDVAGQRSERKKWMGFFNDCTCVVFVAALSEYDQVLAEEPSVNRLQESLQTFQQLTTIHWFDPIPLILLLNKADLYYDKVQRVSIKVCFPKYRAPIGGGQEGNEAEEGLEYIRHEFLKRVRGGGGGGGGETGKPRPVFVHVVSAVLPEAVRVCMKQVNAIVRERAVQAANQTPLL